MLVLDFSISCVKEAKLFCCVYLSSSMVDVYNVSLFVIYMFVCLRVCMMTCEVNWSMTKLEGSFIEKVGRWR